MTTPAERLTEAADQLYDETETIMDDLAEAMGAQACLTVAACFFLAIAARCGLSAEEMRHQLDIMAADYGQEAEAAAVIAAGGGTA